MNEINELERQLRSWVPRRPSATVKQRVLAQASRPEPSAGYRMTWLAPATAALLLAGIIVNQRVGPSLSIESTSGPWVTLAMSNQNAAAWLPGSFAHEQNSLPAETFEWTNGSRLPSSTGSLPGSRGTN